MRKKVFVSGLVNIESTLKISDFPITYSPIEYLFDGISSKVSGVGYNVSKAIATLGDEVHIHTLVGDDAFGKLIIQELEKNGIGTEGTYKFLSGSPQSIIIYDSTGKRKIYCDLKNVQETSYPDSFMYNTDYDLAILTNVNFSREFFSRFKGTDTLIATDCHVMKEIDAEYDLEFLQNADIVFLSNEAIQGREQEFMEKMVERYNHRIVVIAMGSKGSMLYERRTGKTHFIKAVTVRPIVNTIGAGDALFSSFLHFYIHDFTALESIQMATYFASYKIGANGGAEGFLKENELFDLMDIFED